LRLHCRMDRREPSGMLHISHSYSLPGHAAFSPDGRAMPYSAPRLDALRHRPRRLPAEAHESRRTRAGLCLDLPAPFLTRIDLATPPRRLAGNPAVYRDVISL